MVLTCLGLSIALIWSAYCLWEWLLRREANRIMGLLEEEEEEGWGDDA